jgi:hypothetical protein
MMVQATFAVFLKAWRFSDPKLFKHSGFSLAMSASFISPLHSALLASSLATATPEWVVANRVITARSPLKSRKRKPNNDPVKARTGWPSKVLEYSAEVMLYLQ